MLRYIRLAFIALTALTLLTLALANRGPVTLRLLPGDMAGFLGFGAGWTMPLFVVILMAVALGVLIGFVWEWLREMRLRNGAKTNARRLNEMERELAVLRDSKAPAHQDEVLAILDESAKP